MSFYEFCFGRPKKQAIYGSAEMMSNSESRELFHYKPHGISLDSVRHLRSQYSRLSTAIIGKPGSGKSVLIKGNILMKSKKYLHSFWTLDLAGEFYRDCHKHCDRIGMINKVINLDSAEKSLKINILMVAYNKPNGIEDLASLLFNVMYQGQSKGDPFWSDSGQNLLIIFMYAVCSPKKVIIDGKEFILKPILSSVYTLLNWAGTAKQNDLNRYVITKLKDKPTLLEDYKSIMANVKGNDNKMVKSIVSTAKSSIAKLVNNPTINEIISDDEFEIETLRYVPQAIYIQVNESRLDNRGIQAMLSILNTFLFTQCFERPKDDEELLEVHAYIDEAGNTFILGLNKNISLFRKYSIHAVLCFQDPAQLIDLYGKNQANVIINNCASLIYFGSVSLECAEHASKQLGKDTKEVDGRLVSVQLMPAQEIRDLSQNKILFIHNHKGKVLTLKPFYKQRKLLKRTK